MIYVCHASTACMQLIGWKDKDSRLLVDVEEIGLLDRVSRTF